MNRPGRTRIAAAVLGVALLALSACGGRPSEESLSGALQESGDDTMTPELADCVAEVLEDSDMEDATLETLEEVASRGGTGSVWSIIVGPERQAVLAEVQDECEEHLTAPVG